MANSRDKFVFIEGAVSVTALKSGVQIDFSNEVFFASRTLFRGLEEHLEMMAYDLKEVPKDHDFKNGTYVYELMVKSGKKCYVRFEGGNAIFGLGYLYSC